MDVKKIDDLENIIGHKFKPENYTDRENYALVNLLYQKELITKEQLLAVLSEYSVVKNEERNIPIGLILVRNGFITQRTYIETVLEHNPDNMINEATISDIIDPEILLELKTMVIAELPHSIYLSTLNNESIVEEVISELIPDKEIIFLSADFDKIDAYLNQLKQIIYGESNFMEDIIKQALKMGASDIHIEPKIDSYSVFFRLIGVKKQVHEGDMEEYNQLIARIKDRSRMDLAERRIPQDGAFQIDNNGKLIDMRVATIPLAYNKEKVVIRLLDPDRTPANLTKLGITKVAEWRKGVSRPEGLALICGPTGSGKTTTLQASIREMNRFEKSIYTIEDPVEYRIPYVNQVNINELVGLTFSKAIRAFMRADPDVIMVGEIRDEETARNAIKAAETGHLVVGTLHTSGIRSTVDRLRDLGVDSSEIKYILRTVLVQKLVRTLCEKCHGEGCSYCHNQGYAGRTVVSECHYFEDDVEVQKMMDGQISWPIIIEDAILKVEEGVTNAEEIIRVFGEEGESKLKEKGLL